MMNQSKIAIAPAIALASMPTVAVTMGTPDDLLPFGLLKAAPASRGKDKNSKPLMREGNKSGKNYPHSSKRQQERMARQVAAGWHQTKQLATKWER